MCFTELKNFLLRVLKRNDEDSVRFVFFFDKTKTFTNFTTVHDDTSIDKNIVEKKKCSLFWFFSTNFHENSFTDQSTTFFVQRLKSWKWEKVNEFSFELLDYWRIYLELLWFFSYSLLIDLEENIFQIEENYSSRIFFFNKLNWINPSSLIDDERAEELFPFISENEQNQVIFIWNRVGKIQLSKQSRRRKKHWNVLK